MSNDNVQLPTVSTGTAGQKVDSSLLTIGGVGVERQRVSIGDDATGGNLAQVINTSPAGAEYGLVVRQSGTASVQITGTPSINATVVNSPTVSVVNTPSVTISGTPNVAVTNFPATQTVAGTLTAVQGAAGTQRWLVDGSGVTQPISGTVAVSNFPASQPITGSVVVTSGELVADQGLRGTIAQAWYVDGSHVTQPVSGTVNVGNIGQAVTDAIDVTGFNLNNTNFAQTTAVTQDYLLSRLELKFTTNLARTITVTTDDGTVMVNDVGNTNLNYAVDFGEIGFKANQNVTLNVSSTSGNCLMTARLTVITGTAVPPGQTITALQGTNPWTVTDLLDIPLGDTDQSNSRSTAFAAYEDWVGAWQPYGSHPGIVILGVFDAQPAFVQLEWSSDGINHDTGLLGTTPILVQTGIPFAGTYSATWVANLPVNAYYRLHVKMGPNPTGGVFDTVRTWRLRAPFGGNYSTLAANPTSFSLALLTKATIAGYRISDNTWQDVSISPLNALQVTAAPMKRDPGNEATTPLAANGTFTGAWQYCAESQNLTLVYYSNVPFTFTVQWSVDGINHDPTADAPQAVINSQGLYVVFYTTNQFGNKYYRVNIVNGAQPQAFAVAINELNIAPYTGQYQTLAQQPIPLDPALLTRSVISGARTDNGLYQNVALTPDGALAISQIDSYDRSLGAESIALPYISQDKVQFNFPFANNNVTTVATGGATTTQSAATGAVLTSSAAAGASQSQIQGLKKIRYSPGRQSMMEFSAVYPARSMNNSDVLVGLSDTASAPIGGASNSLLLGYIGTTFGFHYVSGGVVTTVPRASWNGDPLNGSTFSAFTSGGVPVSLDVTKGNAWRIRFVWYGVGPVVLEVKNPDGDWVIAHTLRYQNTATVPYIQSPELFMVWDLTKTASAGVGTLSMSSFSANAGTVEPEIDFERYEVHGHKQVQVAVTNSATTPNNIYTVSTGRILLVQEMTLTANNTGGVNGVITVGDGATVLFPANLGGNNTQVTIPITFPTPLLFSTNVTVTIVAGTLTYSLSLVGYEKEA